MKVCVLQPDYSASSVDYRNYDPTRDLSGLLPEHTVHHEALDKRTTYAQLKRLSREGFDIYVNLCEGYLDWDVPSIDVIESLERLNLPYTGPTPKLYDPSKALMKYVAYSVGVTTPKHALVRIGDDVIAAAAKLRRPLFVKPAHAGDSLGIDESSLIHDAKELLAKATATLEEYGEILVEEYIAGREFTVLVLAPANEGEASRALVPVEFEFPKGTEFKTYALKTSELHPEANVPVRDETLAKRLQDAALKVFKAFGGVGYARMDFRMDAHGTLYFLEANFTCSVFYRDGYEGSADYILKHDGIGQRGFLEHIIAEGMARYQRAQKPYAVRGNAISGYGIFAKCGLPRGSTVFCGEGTAQRIITARHVAERWSEEDKLTFRRYGYPLSSEVYALWSDDPSTWAPQNHSCEPNCEFDGLDTVTLRDVAAGEELTLDYAAFMNEESEPFECGCGAPTCRGTVFGTAGNSVSSRERAARPPG